MSYLNGAEEPVSVIEWHFYLIPVIEWHFYLILSMALLLDLLFHMMPWWLLSPQLRALFSK